MPNLYRHKKDKKLYRLYYRPWWGYEAVEYFTGKIARKSIQPSDCVVVSELMTHNAK